MKKILGLYTILLLSGSVMGQQFIQQFFDGEDTIPGQTLIINIDTTSGNIWQIGKPQKAIFNEAASAPNAILTDSINFYPVNNQSSFSFKFSPEFFGFGILAIQWMQKLDFSEGTDGGILEFSNDQINWQNAFNNPYVYAFYGFETDNMDTLTDGTFAFSGTDTSWRNIWLCFDLSWLDFSDTLYTRFRISTDDIADQKEGWMMDNFIVYETLIHTINETEQENYIQISPNPTQGRLDINIRKIEGFHIIEKLDVLNESGRVIQTYRNIPTKFYIDLQGNPPGIYLIHIQTNRESQTFKVVLTE